jgi:hypothetical protein
MAQRVEGLSQYNRLRFSEKTEAAHSAVHPFEETGAMSRYVSFITGAILGIFVGGLLSLLLTPYSGEQLRLEARHAADARREQLQNRLAELRSPRPPSTP